MEFVGSAAIGNDHPGGYSAPADAGSIAPQANGARLAKAAFDRLLALCALILLVPALVLVALAVKLDSPGPVLFRQRRTGLNGRIFTILKFRSMADACDDTGQARRGDARVTRVGAFLRRSSLDELPQFLNVLRGEMSLVGPRPHAVAHDVQYLGLVGDYARRYRMKPGMTGWAQINGARGETADVPAMQARVDLDLWYAAHWSLGLDLRILGRTCLELCRLDAY